MKHIIIILISLLSHVSLSAEPYDKVIEELSKCKTMTEFNKTRSKFYSRSSLARFKRNVDFGYKHVFHDFSYNYSTSTGSYYKDFRFYALVKNDTICFGRIEQLHWSNRVEKRVDFQRLNIRLSDYVKMHNNLYKTRIDTKDLINELTKMRYFSFCCGDGCSHKPKEAKKLLRFIKQRSIKKIKSWLTNPNPEIQAYAVWGLKNIEKKGYELTAHEKKNVNHLLERNTLIYNCAGCLMGLQTPLKELIEIK